MTWHWKSAVIVAIASLAGTVALREYGPDFSPFAGDERAAGNSGAHAETAHADEHGDKDAHGKDEHSSAVAKADEHPDEKGPDEKGQGHGHEKGEKGHGAESEGLVKLTPAQIQASGIETAPAASGTLIKEIAVPGRVALNGDKQARVVPKVAGTVAAIAKRLGEKVEKDEVLAAVESREIADAKSEYLEAWRMHELAKGTFEREERLWKQKVTAEQDYLTAKNASDTATIKLDSAHQRLHAIGMSEDTIAALLKTRDDAAFRTYEVRAPIAGQVTNRDLVLGQVIGTDKEIFTIADLSTVWVELAIQPADLPFAAVGQEVRVTGGGRTAPGKIVVLSPIIDPESRSAKAIAEIDNAKREWNLGDSVNAQLISGRIEANLLIPKSAIQTIKGQPAVFVSEGSGFKLRSVSVGREDSTSAEIVSGLEFGETIATTNTFTLKAELGKAEAEHQH